MQQHWSTRLSVLKKYIIPRWITDNETCRLLNRNLLFLQAEYLWRGVSHTSVPSPFSSVLSDVNVACLSCLRSRCTTSIHLIYCLPLLYFSKLEYLMCTFSRIRLSITLSHIFKAISISLMPYRFHISLRRLFLCILLQFRSLSYHQAVFHVVVTFSTWYIGLHSMPTSSIAFSISDVG